MAASIARARSLLPTLESGLKSFTSSTSSFQVIRTVPPLSGPTDDVASVETQIPSHLRSLFILDSSYNPPSLAHFAMASAAISKDTGQGPSRLLLLFSTHNADKAPTPASFAQRLAMMVSCAEDLQVQTSSKVAIDIGLTTAPYYADKSISITNAVPAPYPSKPTHIHLLGYDTLTRFLAPKYYPSYDPPLSALESFFGEGHKLLVLLRPASSSDNAVSGDTEEEQRKYIADLRSGSLAKQGMKPQWADQVSILEGEQVKGAAGISSTVIRKAAKEQEWMEVDKMCTTSVAAWIQDQRLYEDMDKGSQEG